MEGQEGSVKMIQEAIQRLIEENREDGGVSDCHSSGDGKDWQSFSCLLSQKLRHPFRALGSLFIESLKGATVKADQGKASEKVFAVEVPLPPLAKLPEFPNLCISSSIKNSSEEQ
ncbi:hypothetical protein EJ110_NYTH04776 [Nymphaea thermarum]|nr:hypothetical protein EJ110_NYTH04776 [Nymphaea thermarum]